MLTTTALTYADRLDRLRANKLEQVRLKLELGGPRDADEQGQVPLPLEVAEVVEAVSGSGVAIKDLVLKGFSPEANHPSGGFFGPAACGAAFRALLDAHPTYLHPANSMAGVYMTNFLSYRSPHWNPDFDTSHLRDEHRRLGIEPGIGGTQHFCPDLAIGLELGWGGLLAKVRQGRLDHPAAAGFYDGLENVIRGVQDWIGRHVDAARALAAEQAEPELRENLESIAAICERLVDEPPMTFREACQWLTFYQAIAKMYNGSGEWGQLDELLRGFYERDTARAVLTDDEAIFHLACLLLSETAYIQLGGPDASRRDVTSRVSFLILEAGHRLKTPVNAAVRVGPAISAELLHRSLEILFEDRLGFPKFVADDPLLAGFERLGHTPEVARSRVYAGCHWLAIPGREYCMADMIKIDLAKVFDVALHELLADEPAPTTATLFTRFEALLQHAVAVTAEGIDLHLAHMHEVFPELVLDLCCHGPVERGLDASHGGVEFTNIGVDGSSLATVADSFGAIQTRVEEEGRLTWEELGEHLASDWAGDDGERARLMMRTIPRFGSGDSAADGWAERITRTFTDLVVAQPTPGGATMVPGLFSWAAVIPFGKRLGATPDGRRAGEPVSHGPNPQPGCNRGKPSTPVQLATAVARVQPGYGNTAPLQLDLDPGVGSTQSGLAKVEALLRTHFAQGGTMANLNVLDKATLLAAKADPDAHRDLIVRVTGFSAYFASLSDEMQDFVVDRMVSG